MNEAEIAQIAPPIELMEALGRSKMPPATQEWWAFWTLYRTDEPMTKEPMSPPTELLEALGKSQVPPVVQGWLDYWKAKTSVVVMKPEQPTLLGDEIVKASKRKKKKVEAY